MPAGSRFKLRESGIGRSRVIGKQKALCPIPIQKLYLDCGMMRLRGAFVYEEIVAIRGNEMCMRATVD